MNTRVAPPPAHRSRMSRLTALFWRKPSLGLFLLLLAPLMWFGIVYLGSLLTLLWQGFYTFDDFTMAVTPELTFANILALFNPANYDIILRTLMMAIAVTIASAILAFPMAWYMARYTRGKWKAFFYIAVMLPMWASYIVKAYAWTLLLAKDGVAQWFLSHLGLEPILTAILTLPAIGGNTLSTSGAGAFSGVRLYLAAVYDPAGTGGAGATARVVTAGFSRSRARDHARLFVTSFCRWQSRHCRRVNLHFFPDAGRFHCSTAGGAAGVLYWQYGLFPAGRYRQYAHGRGLHPGTNCPHLALSGVRETSGSIRCTLNAHRCS